MKKYQNLIYKVFETFIIVSALSAYVELTYYSFAFLILYFSFLILNFKLDFKCDKSIKKISIFLGIVFALFISFGKIISDNIYRDTDFLISYANALKFILIFAGFVFLFYKIIVLIFNNISKIKLFKKNSSNDLTKKELLIFLVIILICWLIRLIFYFPAIMTYDSFDVINNVQNFIMSDHHTFGHTWFFGAFYYLGKFIFNSDEIAILLYILIQALLMSGVFIYCVRYLNKLGLNKKICYILILFIALNPLYGKYSITLWRDVLFGMAILLMTISLYEYSRDNFQINKKNLILFNLSLLFILFFRNNGIYVFMFITPFIIFMGNNKKIYKALYCGLIIGLYFFIKGPCFEMFGIQNGLATEGYSIPIQQTARLIASNKKIEEDDYIILSKAYDAEFAKNNYVPFVSDPIKETVNPKYIAKHKKQFFGVWLKYSVKYPVTYLEAYLSQTFGYWYPDIDDGRNYSNGSSGKYNDDIITHSIINGKKIDNIKSLPIEEMPFGYVFFNSGFYVWILIIVTALFIYKKGFNSILFLTPIYGVWCTLMIAAPVAFETRYLFGLFASLPFACLLLFDNKKV